MMDEPWDNLPQSLFERESEVIEMTNTYNPGFLAEACDKLRL